VGTEDSRALAHAERVRDHWWPRPGWRPGRIMCTWHLTFGHAPALHDLVTAYHRALAPLPGLDLVTLEWLHLTVQGVGYREELTDTQLDAVTTAVQAELAAMPAFDLTFCRAVVLGEAIALPPEPTEPLHQVLPAIRAGIQAALGSEARTGPEQRAGFRPHVTIAYSCTEASAEPYARALHDAAPRPARVPITDVALIDQDRQLTPARLYHWHTRAVASLAQ
jgi:2'-5' RNA ligase